MRVLLLLVLAGAIISMLLQAAFTDLTERMEKAQKECNGHLIDSSQGFICYPKH